MNCPSKYITVYNIGPSVVDRETVVGKLVYHISKKNQNKRKIDLTKKGVVEETMDPPEYIKKKLEKGDLGMFWVKLENGIVLPSTQILIVENTLVDTIHRNFKRVHRLREPNRPRWSRPVRKEYKDLLNNTFTCNFLFMFFKYRNRDIVIGWESPKPRNDLFEEVKGYADEWTNKNVQLFDRLYSEFLEKHS